MVEPYAPAAPIHSSSPCSMAGSSRSRAKKSPVSQIGPTTSVVITGRRAPVTGFIGWNEPYSAGRIRSFIAPSTIVKCFSSFALRNRTLVISAPEVATITRPGSV